MNINYNDDVYYIIVNDMITIDEDVFTSFEPQFPSNRYEGVHTVYIVFSNQFILFKEIVKKAGGRLVLYE